MNEKEYVPSVAVEDQPPANKSFRTLLTYNPPPVIYNPPPVIYNPPQECNFISYEIMPPPVVQQNIQPSLPKPAKSSSRAPQFKWTPEEDALLVNIFRRSDDTLEIRYNNAAEVRGFPKRKDKLETRYNKAAEVRGFPKRKYAGLRSHYDQILLKQRNLPKNPEKEPTPEVVSETGIDSFIFH